MMIKHSLIVPCYNEEGNVEDFFELVRQTMKDYTDSYEIVFVNDGSRDKTPEKLRKIFKENPQLNIKVISFSRNFGKEAAIYAGLTYSKGEYVTIIDADLQQHPSYVVQMGRLLDESPEYDMVAAFQESRKEGAVMSGLKAAFYKLINKATGLELIADASDFRTMRRCVVQTILSLPEYHRFSKGIFTWVGFNTASIPYKVSERKSGETKWSFMGLVKYALDGIIAYTDLPLKLPLGVGAVMSLLSVIQFIVFLLIDIFTEYNISAGYIASTVLLTGGIICCFMGVIGYYLGKIHTQVKHRPIFIAKEILNYEDD